MKAYKALDKDMKCMGHQFEVGKTYEEPEAKLCECGFHACDNPLDTLNYYNLTESRFAEVDLDATDETHEDDTKRVGKKIHIKAELSLKDFIRASVDFLFASNSAREGETVARDRFSQLAASGDCSQLAASGDGSKLAASGDCSQLAASGCGSQLAASGDGSQLAASGDGSKLAASGYGSKLAASGENSVAMNAGINGIAKASKGSWITLAEWKIVGNKRVPMAVVTHQVDGDKIKADTWYMLEDGEFVEVDV